MRRSILFSLVYTAVATVACSSSTDIDAPVTPLDGGFEASPDSHPSTVEAGFTDRAATVQPGSDSGDSGAVGACTGGESGADDVPDDLGTDTNCDGADGVVGRDVYVDPQSGTGAADGTPATPLKSLDAALAIAAARNGNVLVSSGAITVTKIDQVGAVAIYGGYLNVNGNPPTFTGKPDRTATVLKAASDTGIYLDNATNLTLAHLTVQGADAAINPSAHALRTNVASLTLVDVMVQAGNGADGVAGAMGPRGQNGNHGGVGSSWWPSQPNGAKGLVCDGGAAPDYTNGADANQPNVEGKVAGSGTASEGAPGSPGQGADSAPTIEDGLVVWRGAADGSADGTPGYGGPGGIPLDGMTVVNGHTYSFSAGGGGTGGCPGGAGKGGASGGGSIAILVLQGKVIIKNSLIRTGNGGNGGNGGKGGDGGDGGIGGVPDWNSIERPYPPAPFAPAAAFPEPCPSSGDLNKACAAYGRPGAKGGSGGAGGPGAGGWSVGILSASGASAVIDPSVQFQLGGFGSGGATEKFKGPDGRKQTHYELR